MNTEIVNLNKAEQAIKDDKIDSLPWTVWLKMPNPENCRFIKGPENSGVYQIRNSLNRQYIQFGVGKRCQKRMKSLFPKPYGTGTRNNALKREHVLDNWQLLEYRTLATETKSIAKLIEDFLKEKKDHLFNT